MGDLSRRVLGVHIPYLSFREYLVLRSYPDYGRINPFGTEHEVLHSILRSHNVLALFEEYLTAGMRLIFMEGLEYYSTKVNLVARKTIEADIPVLQVNSLCREWKVGMEQSG
jgi:predicted AAA+ superfamily ATPase